MKDLATGEIVGEPLPHEEWLAEQRKVEEQDAKDRASRRPKGANVAPAPAPAGDDLNSLTVAELHDRAKAANIEGQSSMNKAELVNALSK